MFLGSIDFHSMSKKNTKDSGNRNGLYTSILQNIIFYVP